MPRHTFIILTILILAIFLGLSHAQQTDLERGGSMLLAGYTDRNNDVAVSVHLIRGIDDAFFLEATFVPPAGYHLYSKDLPRGGDSWLGRPTLLELPFDSRMQPAGHLVESVRSATAGYEPNSPWVYPPGPVSLTLPVRLPPVDGWVEDQISLTYMACSTTDCKIPTIEKPVSLRIPGALSFSH